MGLGVVSLVVCFGAVASFGYAYNRFAEELPELGDYESVELAQTSVVYDRYGEPVDELYGVQNRYVVQRDEVSPYLRDAVVAIEDNRFYQHEGLDFEAIGRAMVQNVRNLSIQEGGSTITQQLIKNTYIDQELRAVPSFQRKINEAALAWQYEDEYPKREILNQYLNTVYFGENAYGAEAAARTYFDKSADELELSEAAMLAGIINLPGTYEPFAYPVSAEKRRNVVLDQMLAQERISEEQHREAVSSGLGVTRGDPSETEADDYFLNAVRQEIIREYGQERLYQGGLDIYTTLDPELQGQADESVEQILDPNAGDPSASLVSIESSSGAVRAVVGGSDFDEVQFNLATQAQRQPGSTFKAFVLAEAIQQGISLDTVYESRFLRIPLPESEEVYEVDNYRSIRRGEIDLREATEFSDNTVFVQLALDLGMQQVVDTAKAMGIEAELEPFPSTAIGGLGEGVSPLEMASAYSTLANGGVHAEPYFVEEVRRSSDGQERLLEEHEAREERILSENEAATVTQALEGIESAGIGREYAGKTGTTDRFIDAWYVGYVPQLTTSVWVGYPAERRSMVNLGGYEEINGAAFPLDIWSTYMQSAVQSYPVEPLAEPSEEFLDGGLAEDRIGIPPEEREDAEEEPEETESEEPEADNAGESGSEAGEAGEEPGGNTQQTPQAPRRTTPGAGGGNTTVSPLETQPVNPRRSGGEPTFRQSESSPQTVTPQQRRSQGLRDGASPQTDPRFNARRSEAPRRGAPAP